MFRVGIERVVALCPTTADKLLGCRRVPRQVIQVIGEEVAVGCVDEGLAIGTDSRRIRRDPEGNNGCALPKPVEDDAYGLDPCRCAGRFVCRRRRGSGGSRRRRGFGLAACPYSGGDAEQLPEGILPVFRRIEQQVDADDPAVLIPLRRVEQQVFAVRRPGDGVAGGAVTQKADLASLAAGNGRDPDVTKRATIRDHERQPTGIG